MGPQRPVITSSPHPGCVHCSNFCLGAPSPALRTWSKKKQIRTQAKPLGAVSTALGSPSSPAVWRLCPAPSVFSNPRPRPNETKWVSPDALFCPAAQGLTSQRPVLPTSQHRETGASEASFGFLAGYRKGALSQSSTLPGGGRAPSAVVLIGTF